MKSVFMDVYACECALGIESESLSIFGPNVSYNGQKHRPLGGDSSD